MFSCIRLQTRQQCCEPKIGGETPVTNNLSSESSMDQIQYMWWVHIFALIKCLILGI